MKVAAVRDISEQIRGVTYVKSDASSVPRSDCSPILRANNIGEHGLLLEDLIFVPNTNISPKQRIVPNDIIVAASSGSISVVGKTAQARIGFDGAFGAFCKVLRPGPDVDPHYVGHYFKTPSYRHVVSKLASGANINNLKKEHLDNLQILLPPLVEQKRIARLLDAADALRAKRREALGQLDTLLQSTFLDMFGDPVTNPMGWTNVRSGELFLLPPKIGTITPAAGRGYLVVRVGEVGESRIAFERCGRVEISEKDFAKFRLERGDTVIARAIGSKNHLGKASFFADFDEPTVIDSHVMRLRPDPIKCDGLWFYSLISSDRGKVLLQQTGGATAVQFNINAKQASSVQVALPPLDLQHRFGAIVESVEQQRARQRAHLAELDTLFASLQTCAFRGDL